MGLADIDKFLRGDTRGDEGPPGVQQAKTGRFLESPSGQQVIQRPPTVMEGLIGGQRGAGGLRQFVPEALATIAPSLIPGGGPGASAARRLLSGPPGRVAASEAGNVVGSLLTGQKPSLGRGAGPQAAGETVSAPAMFLASPLFRKAFASRSSRQIAEELKKVIPAWRAFSSDERGLHEMAHGTGFRPLSEEFGRAVESVKERVPADKMVTVPPETLGILAKSKELVPSEVAKIPARTAIMSGVGDTPALIEIPAREAIDALPQLREKNPGIYRRVLDSVHEALGGLESLGDEFKAARRAYSWGKGFQELADTGQFLAGKRYSPEKAMETVGKEGRDILLKRGMDPVRAAIEGPNPYPMTGRHLSPWEMRAMGALTGAGMGTALTGHPGWGTVIGGGLGIGAGMTPMAMYRNVPRGPVGKTVERTLPGILGEILRYGIPPQQ